MFEMQVVSNTPLTPLNRIDEIVLLLFNELGYFPKGYNPKTDAQDIRDSVPFKLLVNHFLKDMEKVWIAEELAFSLKTTKATIYRHVNKLLGYEILESMGTKDANGEPRRGFRVRYGSLSKAWNFTEASVEIAMDSYRKSIDHLSDLAQNKSTPRRKGH